jgi:hypothetical protein
MIQTIMCRLPWDTAFKMIPVARIENKVDWEKPCEALSAPERTLGVRFSFVHTWTEENFPNPDLTRSWTMSTSTEHAKQYINLTLFGKGVDGDPYATMMISFNENCWNTRFIKYVVSNLAKLNAYHVNVLFTGDDQFTEPINIYILRYWVTRVWQVQIHWNKINSPAVELRDAIRAMCTSIGYGHAPSIFEPMLNLRYRKK